MADDVRTVATNRKAFHDYFVQETFEAGIALTGTEIKSVRAGALNLRDAYAQVRGANCGSKTFTSRRTSKAIVSTWTRIARANS